MGRGEKILVVDDIEDQCKIAAGMLTKLGYNVECVSSGEDAVAYVRSRAVDILVLDMIMEPGIDGLETYRQILEIWPDQKAVITSGFSESDRVVMAQEIGAGAYVKKPYRFETIARAVREELDRKTKPG
jgi:DNA-binding NtrC family response regulator